MNYTNFKILVVDDEPDVLELLETILKRENLSVFTASNGHDALRIAAEIKPELIILDVMMPVMDGIETCRELKKLAVLNKSIITFLTARGEDYSQIAGFDAGADDYILKPISPRVLTRRVKALLRRFIPVEDSFDKKVVGSIEIIRDRYLVVAHNHEVNLPKKEFELLWLLASKVNRVFTRQEIFTTVWGDTRSNARTIDVHVRKLREKLEINNIKTVKGIGYKFVI
ncbi:MAG: response regulator transcription factor [Bacteroidota bacterium]